MVWVPLSGRCMYLNRTKYLESAPMFGRVTNWTVRQELWSLIRKISSSYMAAKSSSSSRSAISIVPRGNIRWLQKASRGGTQAVMPRNFKRQDLFPVSCAVFNYVFTYFCESNREIFVVNQYWTERVFLWSAFSPALEGVSEASRTYYTLHSKTFMTMVIIVLAFRRYNKALKSNITWFTTRRYSALAR